MTDSSTELWRPIPGFEGIYEVSNMGRLKYLSRMIPVGWGKWQLMPTHVARRNTRPKWSLRRADNTGYETVQVARLVYAVFIGPLGDEDEVRHRNGNPRDMRAVNLALATPEQAAALVPTERERLERLARLNSPWSGAWMAAD